MALELERIKEERNKLAREKLHRRVCQIPGSFLVMNLLQKDASNTACTAEHITIPEDVFSLPGDGHNYCGQRHK